jgi:RHS repeat-associated protein
VTSPAGRQLVTRLDLFGRPVERRSPGVAPFTYTYDARGRLETANQGSRTATYAYDADGYLDTVTDPENRTVSYTYDAAGRVTTQTLPDLREISFGYDANGNLTTVTPPGRPAHAFAYTAAEDLETYTPPDVGLAEHATTLAYNLDRQVELLTRPDGQTIDYVYDPLSGRLTSAIAPRGTYAYSYHPTSGLLTSASDPAGGSLAFGHDGSLLTSATWSGEVAGAVGFTYDDDLRLASHTFNGSTVASYDYDDDGLLTGAGGLVLGRDAMTGFLTGTSVGAVSDDWDYDPTHGETIGYAASYGGSEIYSVSYGRDDLGRIETLTETIGGTTATYVYTYDPAGRLTDVAKDGSPYAHYDYDANSNRIAWSDPWGSGSATPDAQDRLLTAGDYTYTYTANGELATKTANGFTASYDYDVSGALLGATLDNGVRVDYVLDASDRRVGKKIDGTLVQGFLYLDGLNPAAELDGAGAVVSTFVYASKANVPDLMEKDGKTYRLLSDHLGSVRLVVDVADGTIAQRLDYGPFGRVLLDTNPGFQPFGFAGGLYDRHTGLVRFGARDYDPQTGRWTAKDPIGFAGGDVNLYGYVLNDPVNWTDSSGLLLDIIADIAFIGYDVYNLIANRFRECPNATLGEDLLALGLDVVGAAIPFATGLGLAARYGDDAVDLARAGRKGGGGGGGGGGRGSTSFVVTPNGEAVPVPTGASGPTPTRSSGVQYTNGSGGGRGLDDRVTGVRIMDANSNQGPRAVYMNQAGQTVDPATGYTVANSHPNAHQYLEPWE